ncbi:MAG: hypothetical protein R3305_11460, partial [Gammaproteobacteria bacterium]|nr:hypothetical protein [Gammaproteobacteria bacterium]
MTSNEFRDGYANDDERLSALIDGELGANAAAALEARLAAEPALAARLKALRGADRALRDAYAPVADELLPAELLALLADADESGDEAQRANVIPLGRRPEPRRAAQPRSFWIPTSIAAGIALAVGVTLGISLNTQNRLTDTEQLLAAGAPITPDRELFAVIEATPSGQTVALAGTIEATPRLSFQTADGGYCRELALTSSTQQAALVGCRRDGSWA